VILGSTVVNGTPIAVPYSRRSNRPALRRRSPGVPGARPGSPAFRHGTPWSPATPRGDYYSPPLSTYSAPGGLWQDPGRAAELPAEARTRGSGSCEVRVSLSTYGSRGDVEPLVGLAARLRALGAQVRGRAEAPLLRVLRGLDKRWTTKNRRALHKSRLENPSNLRPD
jgi:hypothetical protein